MGNVGGLVEYVGGIQKAIEALEIMEQHSECCEYWDMFPVFGGGRSSRVVKGFKLEVAYPSEESRNKTKFNVQELRESVQKELLRLGSLVGVQGRVVYRDPKDPPTVSDEGNGFWFSSERILIRYLHDGNILHTMGDYRVFSNDLLSDSEFKLDGHGGNWSEYVTGWAYV